MKEAIVFLVGAMALVGGALIFVSARAVKCKAAEESLLEEGVDVDALDKEGVQQVNKLATRQRRKTRQGARSSQEELPLFDEDHMEWVPDSV